MPGMRLSRTCVIGRRARARRHTSPAPAEWPRRQVRKREYGVWSGRDWLRQGLRMSEPDGGLEHVPAAVARPDVLDDRLVDMPRDLGGKKLLVTLRAVRTRHPSRLGRSQSGRMLHNSSLSPSARTLIGCLGHEDGARVKFLNQGSRRHASLEGDLRDTTTSATVDGPQQRSSYREARIKSRKYFAGEFL